MMSDELGVILPPGGAQLDVVWTWDPRLGGSSSAALTTNSGYFSRFRVAGPIVVSKASIVVVSAAGNIDLGLYTSADGGANLSRIASTGSTAVTGTNAVQTIDITAAVTLQPFTDYWAASVCDGAAQLLRTAPGNASVGGIKNIQRIKASVNVPLPATVNGLSDTGTMLFIAFHA